MKKRVLCAVIGCVLALGMASVLSGCDNPLSKETYVPESKTASVSTPTIGVNGTLRVGVNSTNPPMAGQASKIVGIDVDIAAAIADEWGLKLEIVDAGSDPLTSLQNGKIDIALGYDTSSTNSNLAKTSAYLQKGIALFSLNEKAKTPADGSVIAAQSSSMSAWAVGSQFEKCKLESSTDLKSAFTALKDGTANYVAADAVVGTYAAKTAGVDAHIVAMMQLPTGYCGATLATNNDLLKKLNATLTQLDSQGIIDLIETKWLGTTVDLKNVTLTAGAKTTTETTAGTKTTESEEKATKTANTTNTANH